MKTVKAVTPCRFTRSMTTSIAKRLRPQKSQVSHTPASKSPKPKTRNEKGFKEPCNLDTNKDISTAVVLGARDGKRSTSSNVHVVDATEVPPTPNTAPVVPTSPHPYPPAPPSDSSIFSDWLLNNHSCNRNDPPVPLEVIRRL